MIHYVTNLYPQERYPPYGSLADSSKRYLYLLCLPTRVTIAFTCFTVSVIETGAANRNMHPTLSSDDTRPGFGRRRSDWQRSFSPLHRISLSLPSSPVPHPSSRRHNTWRLLFPSCRLYHFVLVPAPASLRTPWPFCRCYFHTPCHSFELTLFCLQPPWYSRVTMLCG